MGKYYEKQETMVQMNTELSDACDEFLEAFKEAKGAMDHLEVCRENVADRLLKAGLRDKQFIRHDGKIITLKEGKVTKNTVAVKTEKPE